MAQKAYLSDEIPWVSMLPHDDKPRVVACDRFGWLMTSALSPPDMSTATPEQRFRNAARFCVALQTLGGGRWVWIEERRNSMPGVLINPPANRAARLYAQDRMAVHQDGVHSESKHYVSVRHSPPSGLMLRIKNFFLLREDGETTDDFGPDFADFARSFHRMTGLMRFLGARVLEGNELATYLRSTISVNDGLINIDPYDFITPQLLDSPLCGGKQLWLGHDHNRLNVRVVQINTYPRNLEAGALDFGDDTFAGLTELGYRIRRVKRVRTQSKSESVRELEWLVKKAAMTQESMLLNMYRQIDKEANSPLNNKMATVTLEESDAMLTELHRGGVLRCQSTDNILVYHEDAMVAKKQAEEIEEILLGKGFGCEINDWANHDAVLGAIPGKIDVDFVRPTTNLLAISVGSPLTKSWKGNDERPDTPTLIYGTTGGTSRFGLSFTIKGQYYHGFVCGGTGGGKSVLLNALGMGHITSVPGGRVMRIESGGSGYAIAKMVGGVTFEIGKKGCGVQPYRSIDRPNDRAELHSWTMARIRAQAKDKADAPEVVQAVEDALRIMSRMHPDERTVTTFCLTVANETAAKAMRFYSNEGSLGHIFDCIDHRSYDAVWINFELSAITQDDEAEAAPALIAYLWRHIMRASSSKAPLMLQMDEASAYVEGAFVRGMNKGLRTYRKLRTQVIFSTQSVIDMGKSEAAHILLNSCKTHVYVQDTAVSTAPGIKLLGELGLTEDDAEIIANMDQAGEYFVFRPGEGKAVVRFDLGPDVAPVAAAMVLATDERHSKRAAQIETMPGDFLDNWMLDNGIDAAELLGEAPAIKPQTRMAAE